MVNPFDQFDESTNPFNQFDASASNPFDQFDGKETPKASGASSIPGAESYDKVPPVPVKESLGQKSLGIGEAALTALTGSVSPLISLVGGTVQSLGEAGQGKLPDWKANVEAINEATTYQPRTETGQHIAEKVLTPLGETLTALGPLAPHFTTGGHVEGTKMLLGKDKPKAPVVSKAGAMDAAIASKKEAAQVRKLDAELTSPMENMATQLGAEPAAMAQAAQDVSAAGTRDAAKAVPRSPMTDMANALDERPAQAKAALDAQREAVAAERSAKAQSLLDQRQVELELAVKKQAIADFNAAERARQEASPTISPAEKLRMEDAAYEAKKAEWAADEARLAAESDKAMRRKQMEIDDTQHVLPDSGQLYADQYGAAQGIGRFDENGMPIRADLSMEAQNLQNPLQRNLWGDELGPALGQDRSLTAALDTMAAGPARERALESLGTPFRDTTPPIPVAAGSRQMKKFSGGEARTKFSADMADAFSAEKKVLTEADRAQLRAILDETQQKIETALNNRDLDTARELRVQQARASAILMEDMKSEASFNIRTRKQGGGILNPFEQQVKRAQDESPVRWFTASPEAGRTKSYSLESQAARPNANDQRYGPGQYIAQSRDFSSVYGGPQGRMYEVGTSDTPPFSRPFNADTPTNAKVYQSLVDKTGSRAAANQMLQKSGYDAITFTSPRGDKLANIFNERPLKDIGPAREKVREQVLTLSEYEPGKDPLHKQRGHIRVPGSNEKELKKIPGLRLHEFLVDERTPEQLIQDISGMPDMPQVTDLNFTKGIDYTSVRTQNPLVKYAADAYKEADGRIKSQQQTYVHEIYTPSLRKLSKEEFTDTWSALQKQQKEKTYFSDEELVNMGFNQKERDAMMMHRLMMEEMLPKANEALATIGAQPITPEVAHLAAKLGGNFRRVMTKDGVVVGALGDTTRQGLAKQVAKFKELYPDTEAGPEKFSAKPAGQRGVSDFMETLSFLGSKDPLVAEFVQRADQVLNQDVLNHRGFKTHTMPKKGVPGMPGDKPWENAYTNAKEGFEAQVTYFNKVLEMAELAKADAKVKPLLNADIGMPNAQSYVSKYRDMAMGKNPTAIGKAVDNAIAGVTNLTDGWSSHLGDAANVGRRFLNMKLLSLDPAFLFSQIVQPIRAIPELAAFVRARGGKVGMFGEESAMKGMSDMTKHSFKMDLDPITKQAAQFAEEHHVYSGDLLEASNNVRSTAWGVVNNTLQKPAGAIEQVTRKLMYFTMVDMLHKNGVTPKEGLFQAAAKFTDMGMNNYSSMESPLAFQNLGRLSKAPYNLASYKWNEISRLAMNAREAMRNPTSAKAYGPVLTSMLMQVTTAGLLGTIGFKEADWITEKISEALGKPTSLTKILLDNGDKKLVGPLDVNDLSYGAGNAANVDMTNRLGMGPIVGSSVADTMMPGASAVGTMAGSAVDLGKALRPGSTESLPFATKKAIVDILPGGKLFEPMFFTKENKKGTLDVLNRNKVEKSVERTPKENVMKGFGFTSARESREKTLEYEKDKQDMFFGEKRLGAVQSMKEHIYEKDRIPQDLLKKWRDAGGNMENLDKTLEKANLDQKVSAAIRDKIKAAQGTDTNRMKRRFY